MLSTRKSLPLSILFIQMNLIFVSLLHRLHSADPKTVLNHTQNLQSMQCSLLQKFMEPASYEPMQEGYSSLLHFFTEGNVQDYSDVCCLWKGIECQEGAIQSISVVMTGHWSEKIYIASIAWIPPTTRVFSMRLVSILANWHMESLPRDLRLFNLQRCSTFHYGKDDPKQINFRALPPRIEEFYITEHYCQRMRSITIDNVPKTLRWLQLTNWYLRKVNVVFESIPENLTRMAFKSQSEKVVKIRGIGGVLCDIRVSHADFWNVMKVESNYDRYLF